MSQQPQLSITSPVYNSYQSVPQLVEQISKACSSTGLTFEIVLVDDGSSDSSWAEIQKQCQKFSYVVGVKLSRNFGQHAAISACLAYARGEKIILLDCDLQDDPAYIPNLLAELDKGFDVVYTRKGRRAQPLLTRITSKIFFVFFNYLTGIAAGNSSHYTTAYSVMTKRVRDAYLQITEQNRHYLMVMKWLGFGSSYIDIEDRERPFGKSSYNFARRLRHAIHGVVYQTDALLFWSIKMAAVIFFVTVLAAIYIVHSYFVRNIQPGWTSLIVVNLFGISINLFFIGVIGIYVGKSFDETKKRPIFIADRELNFG